MIPELGRERLPTPVFWPREFHGLYSPWGSKESDRTERLSLLRVYSGWHHQWLDGITNVMDMNLEVDEGQGVLQFMGL